jgi:hypothetical protein
MALHEHGVLDPQFSRVVNHDFVEYLHRSSTRSCNEACVAAATPADRFPMSPPKTSKTRSTPSTSSRASLSTPVPGGDPVTVQLLRGASGLPARWPRLDQFEGSSFKRILVAVEARQGQVVVANLYAARF